MLRTDGEEIAPASCERPGSESECSDDSDQTLCVCGSMDLAR
jgi:hypothetical protein